MSDKLQRHSKAGLTAWTGTQWVNVSADSSGYLNVNVAGATFSVSGVDGAITDGVDNTIKATVKDYTSSNPLAVVLVDTSGVAYTATGGGGGGGAVTVADGADVAEGATTDLRVVGDNAGSVSAKLRGLNYLLALVTDTVNSWLKVSIQNSSLPVTQSGTWTVQPGNTANTTAWKVDGSAVTQPVSDASGSLTVDAPVGTPVFVRLSDGAAAITTLPVSLASVPSHAVTNVGTFAVQDSEKLADNAGFTDGTTKVQPTGYIYDEVAGTALTENDIAAARINVNRAQVSTLEDGTTRGRYATVSASNALKVDGSAVTQPVSDASGSLTVDAPVGTPVYVRLSDGASAITALPVTDNGGTLSIDDGAGSITVDGSVSIAAGTALIGQVAGSSETSTVYNGTTALTPKYAKIAASISGDNTIVPAVTAKKIRVLAYNFMSEGTVNAKFQSGAAGTDLTGLSYLVANTGKVAPYNPVGWFETGSGVLLNLSLSGAINVGGELVYIEV